MTSQNQDKKKVLLIEPNYANKFPPIGLMKISTYHKLKGYDVTFFKGDLHQFVIERIADKCIVDMNRVDESIDWTIRKDAIVDYIRTKQRRHLNQLNLDDHAQAITFENILTSYKNYYWKKIWEQKPEWDRVFVTTLFTFYWDITIETILFAKKLVKKDGLLQVGGVLASIQSEQIEQATGVKPHAGVLNIPGELDEGDDKIIDNLPLDYSILDEIEYEYPMNNAFYGYTTRGCIRKCPFCAVPLLEPTYNDYIPLKERIEQIREIYGDQKDLLLMDNNVLASEKFPLIIQDIIDSGFYTGSKYIEPDQLAISMRNLQNGINDRAYIRKGQRLILEFYKKIKDKETSYEFYKIISKYHISKLLTTQKHNLINAYEELSPIIARINKNKRSSGKLRTVDFNQGVDARLFTKEKTELLAKIPIKPLRIAFDNIKTKDQYERAVRMSVEAGLKDFSNYLLYNFEDEPIDLYRRLKFNVDLSEELNVNIYSFPMKYHPLRGENSHNRDYLGEHWNRKYIRAVQAILNSTKGKIGKGSSFFYKAFGHTEEEYFELLEMPETFILYRYFFEWLEGRNDFSTNNWKRCWTKCQSELSSKEWTAVLEIIHNNVFTERIISTQSNPLTKELLNFYTNNRNDIVKEGTTLYKLKQQYDNISKNRS